jgi:2-amino-4-hydroxy-6-hydroxymethyldihydropteridine diphosphokinase
MMRCYVSIGSNLDREQHIARAIKALRQRFGDLQCSSVYQSAAEGFEGADFYNLVAAFDCAHSAAQLAQTLREIEHDLGRRRHNAKFADRNIDIDLILYGDAIIDSATLKLPRADIMRYAFVLQPLAELVPHQRHPLQQISYGELWARFEQKPLRQQRIEANWLD